MKPKISIRGIKCDSCDFQDQTVKFENYKEWLNKPCPKCGDNLLTEKDYEMVNELSKRYEMVTPEELSVGLIAKYSGDGTGKLKLEGIEARI